MEGGGRLSSRASSAIAGHDADVAVSAASVWEIAIKQALGKLDITGDLEHELAAEGFSELRVSFAHGLAAGALPAHHRDPFDRMLVAQAQLEGRTIVTSDPMVGRYEVHVLPAA